MLKLNLVLISMLASGTAFAQEAKLQEVEALVKLKYTMQLKRDAELSKDGVTVYNTKTGKTDKYSGGPEAGVKNMESKLEFGGGDFRRVSVEGQSAGFEATWTSVTLSNSDNKALGSGLVDHAEPNIEYSYEKTDKGFVVKGENFITVLEMIEKKESLIGRELSMVNLFLPSAKKEDLKGLITSFSVPNGLICNAAQGKTDTFNCTLEIVRSEKAQVVVTQELLDVYAKVAATAEAEQKERAEEKKKELKKKKKA